MAHFPYIRAPGTWITGTAVTPAEFEAINLYIYKAGNFDDGGTWAPTTPITIGGVGGLTVTGPLLASNVSNLTVPVAGYIGLSGLMEFIGATVSVQTGTVFTFNAGSSLAGTLTISGVTTFTGTSDPIVQSGSLWTWQSGSTLAMSAGSFATLAGTTTVSGVTTFANASDPVVQNLCNWTWESGSSITLAAGSNFVCNGTATFATATFSGLITRTGNDARILKRTADMTVNVSGNVGITKDVWYASTNTNITITALQTTGTVPSTGDSLSVNLKFSANAVVQVNNETGSSLIVEFTRATSGHATLGLVYHGGAWRVEHIGVVGGVTVTGYGTF